ncbi:MAG: alpha/beta fold hydrolase [Chromatiaceae bacterium]
MTRPVCSLVETSPKDTGLAFAALTLALAGAGDVLAGSGEASATLAGGEQVRASQRRLPAALDAPRREVRLPGAGLVSYYRAGPDSGTPLLLVHSINAAPSAFEMRPLFEHYRTGRPVLVPDLPGFGFSDRSDRRYTPALFQEALAGLLREVVGAPADVVAFSLSSEFAAAVAQSAPELIRSLVLISPTGFSMRTLPGGKTGERVHGVLSLPGLSQGLFAALTSRPSIRYFLGISFVGPVPPELVDYAYATAHQPGARYAPLYFLSGQLFTREATERLYAGVTQPVLVLHDRDPNINFDLLPGFLRGRPLWRVERIAPTLGLPHWEKPAETTAAMDRFWAGEG